MLLTEKKLRQVINQYLSEAVTAATFYGRRKSNTTSSSNGFDINNYSYSIPQGVSYVRPVAKYNGKSHQRGSPPSPSRELQGRPPKPHGGYDIPCVVGTPILAIAAGTVSNMLVDKGDAGHGIYIKHQGIGDINCVTADGTEEKGAFHSVYFHLSAFGVKVGDTVSAGQIIGLSGGQKGAYGSGSSTGPHLHWGLKFLSDKACLDYRVYDEIWNKAIDHPVNDRKDSEEAVLLEPGSDDDTIQQMTTAADQLAKAASQEMDSDTALS